MLFALQNIIIYNDPQDRLQQLNARLYLIEK